MHSKKQGTVFDIANLSIQKQDLSQQLEREDIWSDLTKSTQLSKQLRQIENKLSSYNNISRNIIDAELLITLIEEANDETYVSEIENTLSQIEQELETLKLQTLLTGKYDSNNAIITLHSGAGGTESCDWTEMLYRLYICYAEKHNYKLIEFDRVVGEEAGIKSVTFKIEGDNAYGFLKAEKGVHRLVRISPFDANARRHTSFASVEVAPEIEANTNINIRPEDLKIDTFRASGAGGQHVNKTESAIRITHLPTGIIVACQNERSQVQNREQAMKMLTSKLVERQEFEHQAELDAIKGKNKKIEWGSQIRSYVFCPYTMVKDHRTGCETGNIQAVMNGEIDPFILDYLKQLD